MATAVVVADIGVPMFILYGLRAIFAELGLLPPGIRILFDGVIVAVAVFAVITGVARALAAPGRPEWRIGGIADDTASRAYRIVAVAAFLLALGPLVEHLGRASAMPPAWAIGVGGILSVPTALLALYATRILVQGRERLSEAESARSARWRILTPVAAIAAIITVVAAIAGYLAFARFMIEQIAWVWVVAGAYVILSGLADLAINALLLPDRAGLRLGRTLGLSDRTVQRLAVLLSGLARIILFLLAAVVILAPWGYDSTTFVERISGLYYGIEIGSFRITFASVFFALVIFAVVILLSRVFQRWLEQRFLPTTVDRSGAQELDPDGGGLYRHLPRRAPRHELCRHRPRQHRAGRRRAVGRHRLRSPEHRQQLRLRPHPPGRAADPRRRLDPGRHRRGHGQEDQRARHRDRDLRSRLGDHPQFEPDLGGGQEHGTSATIPDGPW